MIRNLGNEVDIGVACSVGGGVAGAGQRGEREVHPHQGVRFHA